MYDELYKCFIQHLEFNHPDWFKNIELQKSFRENSVEIAYKIRECKGDKKVQKEVLQAELKKTKDTEFDYTNLNDGQGIPMSANLDILLMGVKIEKTSVFTSATRPLLLPFRWRSIKIDKDKDQDSTLMMMFKTGDDMRQDALILQLFSIMDTDLRAVGLDMNFTIYNLISFTVDDGLLQFVPNSATVTKIKKELFPND